MGSTKTCLSISKNMDWAKGSQGKKEEAGSTIRTLYLFNVFHPGGVWYTLAII
jgi:hypothetical protein